MNEQIILGMAKPYVKDGQLTYDDFDKIYSILSLKEQYAVTDILYKNNICLVEAPSENPGEAPAPSSDGLAIPDMDLGDDFEILYDEDMFRDNSASAAWREELFVNRTVRQSNEILCALIQQGSRQAAQDLCVKNQRLVGKYVLWYQRRYGTRLDFEDLEQAGFIGLIKAAEKYRPEEGTAFSTYAVWWIKQGIAREIMDNGYVIRIPVHMMERINRVCVINGQLESEGISLPDRISMIAKELGYTEDDVWECLVLKSNYLTTSSLDMPIGEDGDTPMGELIPMEEEKTIEQLFMDKELRQQLDKVLVTLTKKEQDILKLRFGWNDGITRTLEEIGAQYNVTRERIRQIEVKAIRKLRHPSRSKYLKDYWEA